MLIACVADSGISYNRRVIRGVAEYVRCRRDLEMEVITPQSAIDRHAEHCRRYRGFIFTTWSDHARKVLADGVAVVSLSRDHPQVHIARVISDDEQIGRTAAEHLLSQGHRHFAFVGADDQMFSHYRYAGFKNAIIESLGRPAAPVHLHALSRRLASELKRLPKPLGLMAAHDAWGERVTTVCRHAGLEVPKQVAVIGVDDDDLHGGDMVIPPLSTVALLTSRIGYVGCELLMRLIADRPAPPLTLIPPGPLIVRQSTRAVVADDPLVVQAIEMMEHDIDRQITVEQVLDRMNISRRTLELHFKQTLNCTPGKQLLRLKIERAKHLLATTRLAVQQIAPLAGFTNSTHLSHAFRMSTGQRPTEYRQQCATV